MYQWRQERQVPAATVPIRPPAGRQLTDLERSILLFEAGWQGLGRRKPEAIRERFGIGSTTYATRLASLLENPEAEAAYPALVARLRRSRRPSTGGIRAEVAHAS